MRPILILLVAITAYCHCREDYYFVPYNGIIPPNAVSVGLDNKGDVYVGISSEGAIGRLFEGSARLEGTYNRTSTKVTNEPMIMCASNPAEIKAVDKEVHETCGFKTYALIVVYNTNVGAANIGRYEENGEIYIGVTNGLGCTNLEIWYTKNGLVTFTVNNFDILVNNQS